MDLHTFDEFLNEQTSKPIPKSKSVTFIQYFMYNIGVDNYVIDKDTYIVDVRGNVHITKSDLSDLGDQHIKGQIPIQFGKVIGDFNCKEAELINLSGCPQTITGGFVCSYNKITNLIGGPVNVQDSYDCSHNEYLESLEGLPSSSWFYYNSYIYCNHNPNLFSIKGISKHYLKTKPTEIKMTFNDCLFPSLVYKRAILEGISIESFLRNNITKLISNNASEVYKLDSKQIEAIKKHYPKLADKFRGTISASKYNL